jgi:hypothetical protein
MEARPGRITTQQKLQASRQRISASHSVLFWGQRRELSGEDTERQLGGGLGLTEGILGNQTRQFSR